MNTTVESSEEAYQLAESIARQTQRSVNQVASELIVTASYEPDFEVRMVDGWPTIRSGRLVTSEEVRRFLEESE